MSKRSEQATLSAVAKQHAAAVKIIADALAEFGLNEPVWVADNYARAIIARLANHEPPILLAYYHELKEHL
jgi:hypothetical protein